MRAELPSLGSARWLKNGIMKSLSARNDISPKPLRAALMFAAMIPLLTGYRSLGPSTIKRDRFQYATAVSDSWKEQLLLDIVRVRYANAPAFVEVSSMVSGYSMETRASLTGEAHPELNPDSFLGAGAWRAFTDRPTISYAPMTGEKFTRRLLAPLPLEPLVLIITVVVRSLVPQRLISIELATLFRAQTMLIAVAVWILFRFTDFAAQQARARLLARDGGTGFSLIDLLRRIAKVTLLLIGLMVWLDNLGFKVTTIVASLGIIGLAVGLASKNFIEDLIGAMTLHATGVVKRNEAIKFGDQRGVVEDIGLRMITIRSRDRNHTNEPLHRN